jgi:hypothetical protein
MADRPSFLQVDRWHVADDPRLAELSGDPEWRAHLASLRPEPEPAGLATVPPRPRARPWAPAALLAAAALWLVAPDPYVGFKGDAALIVHVKVPGGSAVWDGARPLTAGDQIQVEVRGVESFTLLYEDDGVRTVLATGARPGVVEPAWVLDGPAAGDRLLLLGPEQEALIAVELR